MKDLIKAMKYLHLKGIIHKNLKPGNILVGDDNELVICDFGLGVGNYLIGTYNYMAPELWFIIPPLYSTDSDIFSLGCILYEIYTLNKAYNRRSKDDVKEDILSNKELKFERINGKRIPEIEELIKRMLKTDVNKRIKLSEIEEEIYKMSNIFNHPPHVCGETYISSNYNSLILNLYLRKGRIKGYTFEELWKMKKEEFDSYWDDCLIPVYI